MAKIIIEDDLYETFSRQCEADGMTARGVAHHLIHYYLGDSIVLNIHSHQPKDSQNLPTFPPAPQAVLAKIPITTPSIEPPKPRGRPAKPRKIPHSFQASAVRTTLREITEEDRTRLKLDPFSLLHNEAEFIDGMDNLYEKDGCSLDPIGQAINWCGVPPHWVNLPAGMTRVEVWHPEGHDVYKDPSQPVTKK